MECTGCTVHVQNDHEMERRAPIDEPEGGHDPNRSVGKICDSRMAAGSETRVERVYGRDRPPVVRAHAKQSNGESLKRIVKRKLKGIARIAKKRIKKKTIPS